MNEEDLARDMVEVVANVTKWFFGFGILLFICAVAIFIFT